MICWLGLLVVSMTTAHGAIVMLEGEVYIDGIFTQYSYEKNISCEDIEPAVYKQEIVAVNWTIQKLNENNYVSGTRIGFRVHQLCGDIERTYQLAYNISIGLSENGPYNSTVAIIGPENSREAHVVSSLLSSIPKHIRPLQVGFSTTAQSLSNRRIYSNYFRVIPNDDIQVKAMKAFMKALDWTYLGLIYQNDLYGADGAAAVQNSAADQRSNLCFPHVSAVDIEATDEHIKETLRDVFRKYPGSNDPPDPPVSGFIALANTKLAQAILEVLREENATNITSMLWSEAFPVHEALQENYTEVTKHIYVMTPPKPYIPEFSQFWNSMYPNISMVGLDCGLTCSISANRTNTTWQTPFSSYAIQATMAIVTAINLVRKDIINCPNCVNLAKTRKSLFIEKLQQVQEHEMDFSVLNITHFKDMRLSFPNNGSDATRSRLRVGLEADYNVYRKKPCNDNLAYSCYEKVFEYFEPNNSFRIENPSILSDPKAQCPNRFVCSACAVPSNEGIEIQEASSDGSDMYLVGLAPVHTASDIPLACGGVKNGGFDVSEALKFSTDTITKSHPDMRLGIIIVDSCNDPQIVLNRVIRIHNQGVFKDGKYQKVPILGFIGGWVSDVSLAVANALTKLGYVQISYGASSPLLSNRNLYPYFMRIIPSDVKQAIKMLEIVKASGSNLVQILYSDTAYGRGGRDSIIKYAEEHGICVGQTVAVEQMDNLNTTTIIKALSVNGSPKIIMVFISSFDVAKLINDLDVLAGQGYIYVASEAWGNRDIIANTKNLKDTITIALEIPMDDSLKRHFQSLNVEKSDSLWLYEYTQHYFDCYFSWSYDKKTANRECGSDDTFKVCTQPTKACFKVETWAPFTRWAIEAMVYGAREALRQMCNTTSSICDTFRSNPLQVIEKIRPVKLPYNGRIDKPVFDDNNDGLIEYTVYQIIIEDTVPKYTEMETAFIFNASRCNNIDNDLCSRCFGYSLASPVNSESKRSTGFWVLLAFFLILLIVVSVLVIIIICSRKRKILVCHCVDDTAVDYNDTYMNVVPANYLHAAPDHQHGVLNQTDGETQPYDNTTYLHATLDHQHGELNETEGETQPCDNTDMHM